MKRIVDPSIPNVVFYDYDGRISVAEHDCWVSATFVSVEAAKSWVGHFVEAEELSTENNEALDFREPTVGDAVEALSREELEKAFILCWDLLKFYGSGDTWFAISLIADPPAGDIIRDVGPVEDLGRHAPGRRARLAFHWCAIALQRAFERVSKTCAICGKPKAMQFTSATGYCSCPDHLETLKKEEQK